MVLGVRTEVKGKYFPRDAKLSKIIYKLIHGFLCSHTAKYQPYQRDQQTVYHLAFYFCPFSLLLHAEHITENPQNIRFLVGFGFNKVIISRKSN